MILAATIITPNSTPESYQLEFTSMEACDSARQQLRAEMDSLIGRARNEVLNNRPSEQGWTDYRGVFRAIRALPIGGRGYPDLVATCADHGLSKDQPGQTGGGPVQLTDGTDGTGGKTGATSVSADSAAVQPVPVPAPVASIQTVPVGGQGYRR